MIKPYEILISVQLEDDVKTVPPTDDNCTSLVDFF